MLQLKIDYQAPRVFSFSGVGSRSNSGHGMAGRSNSGPGMGSRSRTNSHRRTYSHGAAFYGNHPGYPGGFDPTNQRDGIYQDFGADKQTSPNAAGDDHHVNFVLDDPLASVPLESTIGSSSDGDSSYLGDTQTRSRVVQIDISKWNEDNPNHQVGVFQYELGFLLAPINSDDRLRIPLNSPYASFTM